MAFIAPGGCYGGGYGNYGNYGGGFFPSRYNQGQYQQNSTDIYTGGGNHFWRERGHFWGGQGTTGYGLNLNQQPGHQRGQDGVLVFDTNRDGKYNKNDVQRSNDIMKAATGNYDFNNDGKVDFLERLRGGGLRSQYKKMDLNHDGRLDTNEMSQAGGRVWIDHSRGGGISNNELYSVYNVPGQNRWGRQGSQRLDFVDPFAQTSHTSPNYPYYGGGPCGCYAYGGGGARCY
jgi:hypothetical protein